MARTKQTKRGKKKPRNNDEQNPGSEAVWGKADSERTDRNSGNGIRKKKRGRKNKKKGNKRNQPPEGEAVWGTVDCERSDKDKDDGAEDQLDASPPVKKKLIPAEDEETTSQDLAKHDSKPIESEALLDRDSTEDSKESLSEDTTQDRKVISINESTASK